MNQIMLVLLTICFFTILSQEQTCASEQFFNGQRCAPCQSNCKCTEEGQCNTCISGYTFDHTFSKCIQCPVAIDSVNIGCSECCNQIQGTAFLCASCSSLSDTFLIGGQCIRLLGCSQSGLDGKCSSCRAGYFLQNGACISCDVSCSSCIDSTFCSSCSKGYFNNPDSHYGMCDACSSNCLTCTSSTTCASCASRYQLAGAVCNPCPTYCTSCLSGSCSACQSGSTLIGTSCVACTNIGNGGSNGCLACSTQTSSIQCSKCDSGYYLNSNQECDSCHNLYPNSALCTSSTLFQCRDDFDAILENRFYKIGSACVHNTNKCKRMSGSTGTCSECYFSSGQYYRLSSGVCTLCSQVGCSSFSSTCSCLSCLDGYQFVNSQCIACQNPHCYTCQLSTTSCQSCAPYYGLMSSACISCVQAACLNCNGDTALCNTCLNGYYNNQGTCYKCQTSCSKCQSSILCTSCQSGHFLNSNGRCKRLPTNCITVDAEGSCEKCEYGYQKLFGYCFPCSPTLFNLQSCEKFCPSYYSETQFSKKLTIMGIWLIFLVLISLQ